MADKFQELVAVILCLVEAINLVPRSEFIRSCLRPKSASRKASTSRSPKCPPTMLVTSVCLTREEKTITAMACSVAPAPAVHFCSCLFRRRASPSSHHELLRLFPRDAKQQDSFLRVVLPSVSLGRLYGRWEPAGSSPVSASSEADLW